MYRTYFASIYSIKLYSYYDSIVVYFYSEKLQAIMTHRAEVAFQCNKTVNWAAFLI
jgi:hypothetical protein